MKTIFLNGAQLQAARHRGRLPGEGGQPGIGTEYHTARRPPADWQRDPNRGLAAGLAGWAATKQGKERHGTPRLGPPRRKPRRPPRKGSLGCKTPRAARRAARAHEAPKKSATQGRAAGVKRRGGRAAEPSPDPGRATPARHGDGGRHTPQLQPAAQKSTVVVKIRGYWVVIYRGSCPVNYFRVRTWLQEYAVPLARRARPW